MAETVSPSLLTERVSVKVNVSERVRVLLSSSDAEGDREPTVPCTRSKTNRQSVIIAWEILPCFALTTILR